MLDRVEAELAKFGDLQLQERRYELREQLRAEERPGVHAVVAAHGHGFDSGGAPRNRVAQQLFNRAHALVLELLRFVDQAVGELLHIAAGGDGLRAVGMGDQQIAVAAAFADFFRQAAELLRLPRSG